ncbi:MAG: glutamate 5-kinase [Deltaproteobacteria bacterium]|nr:glutamate 5-kinase [Deltaproteobacteria bacterium]
MTRARLSSARRVVVKVGTSLLAPPQGGIHARRFFDLASEVVALMNERRQVMLVSSGAVGLGSRKLGLRKRPVAIPEKQAAAAVGQIDLCRRYERAFARHGRHVAQILLTHAGLADRERFLNVRHTLNSLLERGVVPIINENDSVSTEELRFGDNDLLSALVVNTCEAELLILLSHVDGLHDRSPDLPQAARIPEVKELSPEVMELASSDTSDLGTGGMRSKLQAARSASQFGVPTVIADGRRRQVLTRILAGEDIGTLIHAATRKLSSRKHWIAFSLKPRGTLYLDGGAVRALREKGRSLLPIGVVSARGKFGVGDLVRCVSESGEEVARGLISYDTKEVELIKGQRSSRILKLLGYTKGDEIIHRDDLVLL